MCEPCPGHLHRQSGQDGWVQLLTGLLTHQLSQPPWGVSYEGPFVQRLDINGQRIGNRCCLVRTHLGTDDFEPCTGSIAV